MQQKNRKLHTIIQEQNKMVYLVYAEIWSPLK